MRRALLALSIAACAASTGPEDVAPADSGPTAADVAGDAPRSTDGASRGTDGSPRTSDTSADAGPAPTDAAPDVADAWAPPPPYASLVFGAPKPWGDPIPDYLSAAHDHVGGWAFFRGIHDLFVWQGRLHVAYGDADKNLGRVIPIEVRSYGSPADLFPTSDFETQEEQIDHYRLVDGALVIPGVDATEDGWLGNVYVRSAGGDWFKSRTVSGGVHVHDVAAHAGAIWAVGSGSQPDEWNAGDIYAHLWRSGDGGETFEVADRWHNGGEGDARFVWLLPGGGSLYLFGYRTNAQGQIVDVLNGRVGPDGALPIEALADDHPLHGVFGQHTGVAPDGTGILVGVDVTVEPLVRRAWTIAPSGDVAEAPVGDVSVFDVSTVPETGETLLLVRDGAAWGEAPEGALVRVLVTADLQTFTELLALPNDPGFESVAAWEGALYLGTTEGIILRADPAP